MNSFCLHSNTGKWVLLLSSSYRENWGMRQGRKSTLNTHWKDWYQSWSSNTLAIWCEEPTHWKWPWYWEGLKAGGEWGDRGWDGWMASLVQWTGVWASSRRWWRIEKTGVLQSMGSQRVGNDLATEQWHNHVAGKWVSQNWNLGDLSPKPMPLSVDSWWEIDKQSSETHGDCARSCGRIGDPVRGEAGSVSEGSVSLRGVFLRVGLQGGHFRKSMSE